MGVKWKYCNLDINNINSIEHLYNPRYSIILKRQLIQKHTPDTQLTQAVEKEAQVQIKYV